MIIWFSSSSINTKRNSEVCATFFSCVWFFVYIFLYFSYIFETFLYFLSYIFNTSHGRPEFYRDQPGFCKNYFCLISLTFSLSQDNSLSHLTKKILRNFDSGLLTGMIFCQKLLTPQIMRVYLKNVCS